MGTQQFCLKWNNHQSNMLTVFEQLLSTEALVDVTLACDGLSLKAHKMVLSACSPYFQSLFLENPCKHPIVIMKDMRYTELKAIIDFMYRGEVNVSHDQLNALLRTAETLKVKGLAEVSGENRTAAGMVQQEIVQQNVTSPATGPPPQTRSDSPTLLSKRKRGRPRKRSLSDSNRSDDEQVPSKIKEPGSPEIEELSGDASIEANDISLSSNSQTQVHQSLPSSSVHNSHLNKHPSSIQSSHDSQVEEPPSDDGDFEVEPSKLMEQTLTTDVPVMSNSTPQSTVAPSVHIVPLSSSSGLDVNTRSIVPSGSESTTLVPASASIASDSLSSSQMQGPDSPQDIKPALLSFEEPPISPVAGPSQDRSMMMYMDTSGVPAIPGTSYQDNQTAIVQHESQPQVVVKQEPVEITVKQEPLDVVIKEEPLDVVVKQEPEDDQYVPVEALPMLKNTIEEKSGSFRYVCQLCPYTTMIAARFQAHFVSHSSSASQQCPKCGKVFKNHGRLNAHMASHDMERNFVCVYCEKKFKRKYNLTQHMKMHLDTDRFKCMQCDKVLQSNATLKRHMSTAHMVGQQQQQQQH